jgi:hypothetical protein
MATLGKEETVAVSASNNIRFSGSSAVPSVRTQAYGLAGRPRGSRAGGASRPKPPGEVVKTWAFDSVGTRKYALQIKKAGNGNPCLKLVEGVPQEDGTYRNFNITIWSEDFQRLFATLDEVRAFMTANNIKTPEGHKYDPNGSPNRNNKSNRWSGRQSPSGRRPPPRAA